MYVNKSVRSTRNLSQHQIQSALFTHMRETTSFQPYLENIPQSVRYQTSISISRFCVALDYLLFSKLMYILCFLKEEVGEKESSKWGRK